MLRAAYAAGRVLAAACPAAWAPTSPARAAGARDHRASRRSVVQVEGERRHRDIGLRPQHAGEDAAALVVEDLVTPLARHDLGDQHAHDLAMALDAVDVLDDAVHERAVGVEQHLERDARIPAIPGGVDLVALVLVAGDGYRDDGAAHR